MTTVTPRSVAIASLLAIVALLLVAATPARAGTVTVNGNVLTYTSAPGQRDALEIRQASATSITFDDALAVVVNGGAPSCTLLFNDRVRCLGTAWSRVNVDFRDNDDTLQANVVNAVATTPISASGGAGRDRLEGGSGNDILELDAGSGSAFGGGGNDILRSGTVAGTLDGGAGDDTLDVRPQAGTARSFVVGGDGNDSLVGGAAPTYMVGGDGIDVISGGAGSDVIDGGAGADNLTGGDGDDTMSGGATIVGALYTSDGPDSINGGAGLDVVRYPSRTTGVTIDLATAAGNGEAGENDTLVGFENASGGDAADTIFGNALSNELRGENGADTIDGRGGFDQLAGDGDADTITASGDGVADIVDCGAYAIVNQPPLPVGTDTDTANVDHLDLVALTGDCETVNRLAPPPLPTQTGTAQPDTLRGTAGPDELIGAGGADTLRGLGGNDRIRGGAGDDDLYGGNGADDIDGDAGNDLLQGDNGNDTLDGGPGRDVLRGGLGRDALVGGRGLDNLDGGLGPDVLSSKDRAGGDVVTCTRVNLLTRIGRLQRDVVVADRTDVIVNRRFCARVSFT